jgi:hypothetical protein
MDGNRFDAWTRRRFGVVASGLVGSVLTVTGRDETRAKKKKRRCRRANAECGRGRKCCNGLVCKPLERDRLRRCCIAAGDPCNVEKPEECCAGFCTDSDECGCKDTDEPCSFDTQCCSFNCVEGFCEAG